MNSECTTPKCITSQKCKFGKYLPDQSVTTQVTHPMHPGLGVLTHSHQFRCDDGLCEDKLPAGVLEVGGQERPQPRREEQLTARASCKHYTT